MNIKSAAEKALRRIFCGVFPGKGNISGIHRKNAGMLAHICLRRPYSFRVVEKNMESRGVKKMCRWHIFSQDRSGYAARREVVKTDRSPPLWKLPQCNARNGSVPHNKRLNLSVHTSTSAHDAVASRRLFGATIISPRTPLEIACPSL